MDPPWWGLPAASSSLQGAVGVVAILVASLWWWRRQDGGSGASAGHGTTKMLAAAALPKDRGSALLLRPLQLRGLTLRNRLVRAAAFGGSSVSAMHDCHVEAALGGCGMSTLAYACVSPDGRTFASQLVLTRLTAAQREGLRRMTESVREAGGAMSVQLTHAGGFANRAVIGGRQGAPSPTFSPANLNWSRALTRADLDAIDAAFAESGRIAVRELGFDAIELHCGHGYLLSQFLSPSRNVRADEWGGDPTPSARDPTVYEGGRFAFPLRVLRSVRRAVGDDVPILVKLNVDDGFASSGLTVEHACQFARACEAATCDCIVPSCGYVDMNGYHMLRGAVPLWNMVWAIPGVVEKIALALFGKWLVPHVPFERQFLRKEAVRVLESVDKVHVALLGGVRTWQGMEGALARGFALVQTARTLIREPDFVQKVESRFRDEGGGGGGGGGGGAGRRGGREEEAADRVVQDVVSSCTHCNACVVATLAEGADMRCPLRVGEEHFLKKRASASLVDIEDLFVQTPWEVGIGRGGMRDRKGC